jgi:membrane-associated phospholipid phosphatase
MTPAGIDGGLYTDVTTFARDTGWLNSVMSVYSTIGVFLLGVLLAVVWWTARRTGGDAMARLFAAGVGVVLAVAANAGIKSLVAERRPCLTIPHSFTVGACPGPTDYSFPSNHSAIAAALAAAVFLLNRRLGLIAAALAVLEGFSRVYIGVHYPHDVIVGLLVGALVTWLAARLLLPLAVALVTRLERTPLRPLLTTAP